MTHGSLFSGIGGFDLSAEWMGWENMFHCEWNTFGQKVLKYYWPNAISYGDITKTDFNVWRGKIDVLTGGFPCQPFSAAGKRKGSEDARHLWPEMCRAIREIQPRWVVGENVLGLLNWSKGLVFHQVQTDLEAAGYVMFPYVLPACAKDAPHRRDRVWIVAYRKNTNGRLPFRTKQKNSQFGSNGPNVVIADTGGQQLQERPQVRNGPDIKEEGTRVDDRAERPGDTWDATDTNGNIGRERWMHAPRPIETERHISTRNALGYERNTWDNFPTQPPLCGRNDGLSPELAGITISKHRVESIKAYGNSIVPQIAYEIFKAIEEYEHLQKHQKERF